MKLVKITLFSLLVTGIQTTSEAQLLKKLGSVVGNATNTSSDSTLSNNEIVSGLKEALKIGITNGANKAASVDGFLKNEAIKLLLPPEIQKAESTLRKIGLGNEVDKFVETLNRSAEDAAKKAAPIFASAITSMSIQDALGILKGNETAATDYLKKTTNTELYKAFLPVVTKALDENKATKYYADLVTAYNKVPLVKKINPDLKQYATQKSIDGLYVLVAEEEQKIRKDPGARVTSLLQKVFSK